MRLSVARTFEEGRVERQIAIPGEEAWCMESFEHCIGGGRWSYTLWSGDSKPGTGGDRIIGAIQEELHLTDDNVAPARDIPVRHGKMSSSTPLIFHLSIL